MYSRDRSLTLLPHLQESISYMIYNSNIYSKFLKHPARREVINILKRYKIDMYPLYEFLNNINTQVTIVRDPRMTISSGPSSPNSHSKSRRSRRNSHSNGRRSRRNSHSGMNGGSSSGQTRFFKRYLVPLIFNLIYTWMMDTPERWQEGDTVYHNGQVIHLSHIHPDDGIVSNQTVIPPNMMVTIIYVIYNFILDPT